MADSKKSLDAKKTVHGKFKPSRAAEQRFFNALKRVAKASGRIVDRHVRPGAKLVAEEQMQQSLRAYAEKLTPWASKQAAKMLETVERSNKRAYAASSKTIASLLEKNVATEETGAVALTLLQEQVELIKSIPLEAGLRAQKIAYEAAFAGTRAEVNKDTVRELEKQLGLTTEVAVSRAKLIAITETARANASINQARAMAVGSQKYRWHNSGDGAVRKSHRIYRGQKMQGKIFSWDKPPTLDDGMTGHPGTFPRCRCFAEPVFED